MRVLWALVAAGTFLFSVQLASAQDACPVSDKEFLHQIISSSDWMDVHAVFKHNFPVCSDDGLYADGYTNMVVGMMAAYWEDTDTLNDLMSSDEAFKQFIFRHIGISAGEEDLRRVLRSAQANCPKNLGRLCKEIASRCTSALGSKK